MIPCAEIVSRASIINTWKILGDYQVFVENTRESLLTLGSVADSSSVWSAPIRGRVLASPPCCSRDTQSPFRDVYLENSGEVLPKFCLG